MTTTNINVHGAKFDQGRVFIKENDKQQTFVSIAVGADVNLFFQNPDDMRELAAKINHYADELEVEL